MVFKFILILIGVGCVFRKRKLLKNIQTENCGLTMAEHLRPHPVHHLRAQMQTASAPGSAVVLITWPVISLSDLRMGSGRAFELLFCSNETLYVTIGNTIALFQHELAVRHSTLRFLCSFGLDFKPGRFRSSVSGIMLSVNDFIQLILILIKVLEKRMLATEEFIKRVAYIAFLPVSPHVPSWHII